MRRAGGRARRRLCCLVLAALFCWCLCAARAAEIEALCRCSGGRYRAGEGISPAQAERAASRAGDPAPALTLWREIEEQEIRREGGFLPRTAVVIAYWGDAEHAVPGRLARGSIPARGDATGAMVSSALSDSLWGGRGALGQRLVWGGKSLTVRGIWEEDSPVLLAPAPEAQRDELFPAVESPPANGAEDAAAYLRKNGLAEPAATVDGPLIAHAAGLLALLPAWLLAAATLLRFLARMRAARTAPLRLAAEAAVLIPAGCGLLWAAQVRFPLPASWIPARWSDLSFWGERLKGAAQGVAAYIRLPLAGRDLALIRAAAACVLFAAGALFFSVLALERVRMRSAREACGFAMLALLLAFVCGAFAGAEPPPALWAAFPCLFLCDRVARLPVWRALRPARGGGVKRGEPYDGA